MRVLKVPSKKNITREYIRLRRIYLDGRVGGRGPTHQEAVDYGHAIDWMDLYNQRKNPL